jgi:hypothetical protein
MVYGPSAVSLHHWGCHLDNFSAAHMVGSWHICMWKALPLHKHLQTPWLTCKNVTLVWKLGFSSCEAQLPIFGRRGQLLCEFLGPVNLPFGKNCSTWKEQCRSPDWWGKKEWTVLENET